MSQPLTAFCQVPSKLILCGEHSVLYGSTALSLAVDLPTTCQIEFSASAQNESRFQIDLPDLNVHSETSEKQWRQELQEINKRHHAFQSEPQQAPAPLTHPQQLILLCLQQIDRIHPLPSGLWQIKIHSENWLGRGMGSSAAVILATLQGIARIVQLELSHERLLQIATEVECYQHGQSSGLDPATLLAKTVIEYKIPGLLEPLNLSEFPLQAWLIDTGQPVSNTGQCVLKVREHFADNDALWHEFAQVVQQIKLAWQNNQQTEFVEGIRHNQRLLEQIGVVPTKIRTFIRELDNLSAHACAKVCGAGAVQGDAAGVLVYFGEQAPDTLCHSMGFKSRPLELVHP
ncbi:mevalonate kinase [Thiomicrorhabdus xiamenensis]|uniref:GHMP kinase N-terminal domain-containing protein n=1 Tax=Thiomicrorhabdus xiamenensis TaxID=2739063 RepID=A0A7D4NJW0_9GAMM|nr:hypothetical protein [Thiomicrorhabdus xiamenensis]QKI88669.1 hypothetical protein HQN79_03330 [Thiomicrorhabdus xiamenensis]